MPKVSASVIGIDSIIRSAERHSQKPRKATSTTSAIASYSAGMNRSMFSATCSGLVGVAGEDQVLRQSAI